MKTKLLHRLRRHADSIVEKRLHDVKINYTGEDRTIRRLVFDYGYSWAFIGLMGKRLPETINLDSIRQIIFNHVFKEVWKKEKPKYLKAMRK